MAIATSVSVFTYNLFNGVARGMLPARPETQRSLLRGTMVHETTIDADQGESSAADNNRRQERRRPEDVADRSQLLDQHPRPHRVVLRALMACDPRGLVRRAGSVPAEVPAVGLEIVQACHSGHHTLRESSSR